ncbi:hypothetical protein K490DRAFT_62397 [Saccharata proteae CBS 121410]|uniref:Uncharacterized protein n=1 Tax=Saccharata proteae CBS 121410 TaxID=1314787 RepID=A0A9P4I042_9PEZI|nr:hypothetical protein K490DRAFT_62397 [Saccharata proteae CBS 121410]
MLLAAGYSPTNAMFDLPELPLWIILIGLLSFFVGVVITILVYIINAPVKSNNVSNLAIALDYIKNIFRANIFRSRAWGDEEKYELLWSPQSHRLRKDHDEEESIESDGDAGSTTALDYQSPRNAAAAKLTPRLGFRSEPLDEATWIQARAAFDEQALTPRSENFYYQLGSGNGSSAASSRDSVGCSQQDGGVWWKVL